MKGEVKSYRIAGLMALSERPSKNGKPAPRAWIADLEPADGGQAIPRTLLKAWAKDAEGVAVGATVQAERQEWRPRDGGQSKVSYFVRVDLRTVVDGLRALVGRLESRLDALERRCTHLEDTTAKLLRARTEAAERKAGGDPDARHSNGEPRPTEEYLKAMADPERKYPLVAFGRLA